MCVRLMVIGGMIVCGLVCSGIGDDRGSVGSNSSSSGVTRKSTTRIQQELQNPTNARFTDKPLEEALTAFEDFHHINIWIDKQALNEEGINTDTQVTLVMTGITLDSALELMLDPLALTYVVEDGVLKVTTQTKADEKFFTRVYPIADLLDETEPNYRALLVVLRETTSGKWTDQDGDGGSMCPYPNAASLVVRQTQKVHCEIEGILSALRKAKQLPDVSSIPTSPNDVEVLSGSSAADWRSHGRRSYSSWQRPRIHASE